MPFRRGASRKFTSGPTVVQRRLVEEKKPRSGAAFARSNESLRSQGFVPGTKRRFDSSNERGRRRGRGAGGPLPRPGAPGPGGRRRSPMSAVPRAGPRPPQRAAARSPSRAIVRRRERPSFPAAARVGRRSRAVLQRVPIRARLNPCPPPARRNSFRAFPGRRIAQPLTPGLERRGYFGSAAAEVPGSFNIGVISDPAVDALIEEVVAASSRAELTTAVRALGRVLTWNRYAIAQWYGGECNIAYKFGRPFRPNSTWACSTRGGATGRRRRRSREATRRSGRRAPFRRLEAAMLAYVIRRRLMIPTLPRIMIINSAIVQFAPGGPIEQIVSEVTDIEADATGRSGRSRSRRPSASAGSCFLFRRPRQVYASQPRPFRSAAADSLRPRPSRPSP